MGNLRGRINSFANRRLRCGPRKILWTAQEGLGFGNHLYLWLHAHKEQAEGRDVVIRESPGMLPWLERFPELRELTVSERQVQFSDRREWGINPRLFQRFDVDYSRHHLRRFIMDCLAPSLEPGSSHDVVINVRRGDYYSVPEFKASYGMNIAGYVDAALAKTGRTGQLLVVSDDAAWCKDNLGKALEVAADVVEYAAPGAWQHFNAIATASCLVGTNSSFS